MKEYKIIAIHRQTGEQYEIGTESTVCEALYTIANDIEFAPEDNPKEWSFQVVDNENNIAAYLKTINEASKKYQEAVNAE